MNSRLFHLQGVGRKIVNCTQVAKEGKMNDKTKSIDIDKSLCLKVYTKVKSPF